MQLVRNSFASASSVSSLPLLVMDDLHARQLAFHKKNVASFVLVGGVEDVVECERHGGFKIVFD